MTRLRCRLVAALIAVAGLQTVATTASAQPFHKTMTAGGFTQLNALPGASIGGITVDPNNPRTLYAGSATDGSIFKSLDGGSSWSRHLVGGTGFRVIAVDPTNSNIVYALDYFGGSSEGGLFRSNDAGLTWALIPHQPTGSSGRVDQGRGLIISKSGSMIGLTDRNDGFFLSTDAGETWSNTLPHDKADLYGLFPDPNAPNTLWTVGLDRKTGLASAWTSMNFGRTWQEISLSILNRAYSPIPYNFVIQPKTGRMLLGWSGHVPENGAPAGGIIVSKDSGKSWTNSSSGLSSGFAPGNQMAFDPTAANTVYAPTFYTSGLYRSTDAGAHWAQIGAARGLNPVAAYFTVAVIPQTALSTATILVPNAGNGIFRSTDHGQSWNDSVFGLYGQSVVQLADDGLGGGGLYAIGEGGQLLHTKDGLSWIGIDNFAGASDVLTVAVDYLAKNRAVYVLSYDGFITTLWRSNDTGVSWTQLPAPLRTGNFPYISVDPTTAGRIFIPEPNTPATLLRSDDAGDSWKTSQVGGAVDSFSDPAFTSSIVFDPARPGTMYAPLQPGDPPTMFKSVDAGATWSKLTGFPKLTGQITGLAATSGNPSAIFAVTAGLQGVGTVLKSIDGGASWKKTQVPMGIPDAGLLADRAGKRLFAASTCTDPTVAPTAQVSESIDGGASWKIIDAPIEASFLATSCPVIAATTTNLYISDPYGHAFFTAPYSALSAAAGLPGLAVHFAGHPAAGRVH